MHPDHHHPPDDGLNAFRGCLVATILSLTLALTVILIIRWAA